MYETDAVTALVASLHNEVMTGIAVLPGQVGPWNRVAGAFNAYVHLRNLREQEAAVAALVEIDKITNKKWYNPTNFKGYYISSAVMQHLDNGRKIDAIRQLRSEMRDSGAAEYGVVLTKSIIFDYYDNVHSKR